MSEEQDIERATAEARNSALVVAQLQRILDALPQITFVLNEDRRLLVGNKPLLDTLGLHGIEPVRGARPGEAMHCIHAREHQHGCGESEACRHCGAVNAIVSSRKLQRKVTNECRISVKAEDGSLRALDIQVTAVPVSLEDGSPGTLVTMEDISDRKRREALERTFFHDLLNSVSGLRGLLELAAEEHEPVGHELVEVTKTLIEELQEHQDLLRAEQHELTVSKQEFECAVLCRQVELRVRGQPFTRGKSLVLEGPDTLTLTTDPVLLRRVLTNMLKNAVEASSPGDAVRLSWRSDGEGVLFSVHNPAVMPPEVKLQVFQRSFSTKGKGRGLGTYSMRLLTERYLGGRIEFRSETGEGTTFSVWVPLPSIAGGGQ